MTTVYVLFGQEGEYSDRTEWVVGAYIKEVAAIDAANEHRSLCLLCRASFPVGIAGLCASCLYDFYPNDETPTTTSEAHAA